MSAVQFLRPLRRGGAVLALALGLQHAAASAGIAPGAGPSGPEPAGSPADAALVIAQAKDGATSASVSPLLHPAPNLFEATGTAVWDGRRTLQGVWVAHPLATSARRVRIFNSDTGAAVDGALFKRDPALTGPSVLISSQAAELLGMPPGEEVHLRIVALTPVQKHEPPPVAEAPAAAQPAAVAQPAEATAKAPDAGPATRPGAGETMAAMPSAGAAMSAPAPADTGQATMTPGETRSAGAAVSAGAASAMATTPLPPPRKESPAVAPSAEPAPAMAPAPAPLMAATPPPPAEPARAIAADPPSAEPAPAMVAAPASMEPAPAMASAPPPAAPRPAPSGTPEQAAASPLAKPYVQAGTFDVPDNATRLITRLEAAEVPALGKPANYGGREMTRVLAGPFSTTAERDAALRMIREMGLGDALPVAR